MVNRSGNSWPALVAGSSGAGIGAANNGATADLGSRQPNSRDDDPYFLHGSDHPGMMLVSHQLTGKNFLTWKRFMIIALGAKTKLGFINGTVKPLDIEDERYDQWKRVDWMVISWILNSLSKEIVDAFIYDDSAKDLWDDICQRFGESNGPLLYQLQRDILNLRQGDDSVMMYFTKLKKMWDEYSCLVPPLTCKCDIGKLLAEQEMQNKLMQFLMGLSEGYDNVKNQLLLMDPLPTVNKAYSMILSAERQRSVHINTQDQAPSVAMAVKSGGYGKGSTDYGKGFQNRPSQNTGGWNSGKMKGKLSKEERMKLVCDHLRIK